MYYFAALTFLILVSAGTSTCASNLPAYKKRGHGIWSWDPECTDMLSTWAPNRSNGSSSWWYNWNTWIAPDCAKYANAHTPSPLEFVPMQSSLTNIGSLSSAVAALKKTHPYTKSLLGYNEPDKAGRNKLVMTPLDAAANWRTIEDVAKANGLRIGSPAIAGNMTWLNTFMSECDKMYCNEMMFSGSSTGKCRAGVNCKSCLTSLGAKKPTGSCGCTMHFMTAHAYTCDINYFKSAIESRALQFALPVWVTEFGCAPWGWPVAASNMTYTEMVRIQNTFLDYMDSHPMIERYAWWIEIPQTTSDTWTWNKLFTKAPYTKANLSPLGNNYNTRNV